MSQNRQKSAMIAAALSALVGIQVSFAVLDSVAADSPHNSTNAINCASCHDKAKAAAQPTWWSNQQTGVCGQCHNSASAGSDVVTHHNTAGNVLAQCTMCHDPHNQMQPRTWKTESYLYTGVAGTVTSTTLISGATWTADYWKDMLLIPNVMYPGYNYRIGGNTADTITTAAGNTINLTYARPGDTFAIVLGKLIRDAIKSKPVKYFRQEGPNSFADNDAVVDGICQVCHTKTVYFTNTGVLDSSGWAQHPTAPGTKCVSCHEHQDSFKASCTVCHGNPPSNQATLVFSDGSQNGTTGSATAGAHSKHATTTGLNYACSTCHGENSAMGQHNADGSRYVVTMGFSGKARTNADATTLSSYDGQTGVNYDSVWGTLVSKGGSLTCENIYCHSTGQADGGQDEPVYAAPSWNGSVSCGDCHASANISSGSHAAHLNYVPSGTITCENCHTGAGSGSSYSSPKHVDGLVDVAHSYTAGGQPGNGYGTCSVGSCHGRGTPVWGESFEGIDVCTKCHGTPTPGTADDWQKAPPHDTAGSSNSAVVGAHQSHVNPVTNSYSSPVGCDQCHTVPGTVGAPGHIMDLTPGVAEVPLAGGLTATNPGGAPGTPSYASGTCSNVYCHDSSRFKNAWPGGVNHSPTWSTLFIGTNKLVNCNQCHGNPPAGGHPATPPNACATCHPHTNPAGDGFIDKSLHANGLVEGGGCDGCHGNPPTSGSIGGGDLRGLATPPTGATSPASAGAHDKHVNALTGRAMQCDTCHKGTDMDVTSMGKTIDMGFAINTANVPGFKSVISTGTFTGQLDPNLLNGYRFRSSSPGTMVGKENSYANTCSVYCHGSTLTGGSNTSPSWVGGSSEAACGTCHGAGSNFTVPAASPPLSGSHEKHTGTAYNSVGLGCTTCHAAPADPMAHVDGNVTWSLNQADPRISDAGRYKGTVSGSTNAAAPSSTYGSCSNIYCHSIVQTATGGPLSGQPGEYTVPQWGSAATGACGSCHAAGIGHAETNITTGSHNRHLTSYGYGINSEAKKCALCHKMNPAGDINNCTTACHSATIKHSDGKIDISFESTIVGSASPSYSGTPTPGDYYGSCSNVYCHSVVQAPGGLSMPTATGYRTVEWGTGSLNCGSCHVNMATTTDLTIGTHQRHTNNTAAGVQYACSMCHGSGYTASTVNYAKHVNRNIDTAFTGTAAGTTYSQATVNKPGVDGYGTCSTSKCHGRGTKNWGTYSNVPSCEKCHGSAATAKAGQGFKDTAGSTSSIYAGTHVSHLAALHNYSDPIACSECHVVPASVNSPGHMTGVPAQITWGPLTTKNYTITPDPFPGVPSMQCSNTYCHSRGGSNQTPKWGDPAYLGGTGCGKCHGYPPAYPHQQNLNCSGCHDHVAPSNTAFVVDYVLPDGARINGKSLHVNGEKNISEDACLGCHGDTGANALIGAHSTHTNAAHFLVSKMSSSNDYDDPSWIYNIDYVKGFPIYACGFCHPSDSRLHKNGVVDLDMNPSHSLEGTVKTKNDPVKQFNQTVSGSNVTCVGVYCHSNGYVSPVDNKYQYKVTPNWYTPNPWASADKCAQCHGNSPNTGGTAGSPAHAAHVIAVHFKDLFTGTSGKLPVSAAPGTSSAHGDPAVSGTINCNICHIETVTVSYNDRNAACASCHTGSPKGVVTVAPGNHSHVDGIINVSFDPSTFKSKGQIRDDITKVEKLNASWIRINGYKTSADSHDTTRETPVYIAGTCASVSCHNATTMQWNAAGPLSCSACHKGLPQ